MGIAFKFEQAKPVRAARHSIWADHDADLRQMWSDGKSSGQIARFLTRKGFPVTRSAVIGRVHRLGLAGRATTQRLEWRSRKRKAPAPRPARESIASLLASEPLPNAPEPVIPAHERKTILIKDEFGNSHANDALDNHSCRWPIGDPQHEDFHFCGKRKVMGLAYCEGHARRAFEAPRVRRRYVVVAPKEPPVPTFADSEKETV